MDEKGLPEESIFNELGFFSESDTNYKKVLSSMCTIPHPIAVKAYQQFIHTNIGDPGLFHGVCEMEIKVIEMTASLLSHSNPKTAFGHLTSGGTESNIEATLHMKNRFLEKHFNANNNADDTNNANNTENTKNTSNAGNSDNANNFKLNLVLPKTAHFSFEKIANLLDIELRKADVDSASRVIPESVYSLIDKNTIGLVGIAGNTEFGEMDPIVELSKIALQKKLPLHIDAAFGGFVYPFISSGTQHPNSFGFDVSGVTSVSIDPHKMGFSVIPAGILVFRDASFLNASLEKIKVKTPYLTSTYQSTLTGTHPGSAVAATYAVMKHLGREGYRQKVADCMDLTHHLQKKLEEVGFKPYIEPKINILTVQIGDYEKTNRIRSKLLKEHGWNISATTTVPALRFVLMPHVTKEEIDDLVVDLKKVLDAD
ncbi:MAG: tyrosine decarboxylase MfnA [Methanimicrococcus sp.]|nr:tyrosine decarboxylase MfnA [Methanimicrococcus sp.]